MTGKEPEQQISLDPYISPKTPYTKLKEFSDQHWRSNGTKCVAEDMVNNTIELLAGSNISIDLGSVLNNIRFERLGSVQFREEAIAGYDGRMIGGFAVAGGWAMHDPPMVYLSVKCLANRVSGDKLEEVRRIMRQSAVDYGEKVLPDADLYMESLDFLLKVTDRNKYRNIIKQVLSLLGKGDIEEAYEIVRSRDDLVRRRG